MVVSSGVQHERIERSTNQNIFTEIDIVEGTFQLFKLEVKDMLNPLKMYFKYLGDDVKNNKPAGLLRVIYSRTNPKPEVKNCQGCVENPRFLEIKATDERKF